MFGLTEVVVLAQVDPKVVVCGPFRYYCSGYMGQYENAAVTQVRITDYCFRKV